MRKKILLFIVLLGVLGLLSYLGFNVVSKAKEKNQIAKKLEVIPEFAFLTLEQQPFSNIHLKRNVHTVFIYFNSTCDFCQHEAQSIRDNVDRFKKVQFLFVSTEPIATIREFSKQHSLNHLQNITFLYDDSHTFSSQFGATSILYIIIYDQNQKLLKKHKGQLNANGILRALSQDDKNH